VTNAEHGKLHHHGRYSRPRARSADNKLFAR
jgi:hypothetical protein